MCVYKLRHLDFDILIGVMSGMHLKG